MEQKYENMKNLMKEMEELEKKIKDKANEIIPDILKRINEDIKLMQDMGYYIECKNEYILDSLSDTYNNESKILYAKLYHKPKCDYLAKNK